MDIRRNEEELEARDEKNVGHTRGWCDNRNRCSRKLDAGGCSMASWFSRCSRYRRLGGRGHPWRRACSAEALLRLRVRPRARLFRAAMLHPERTHLGRVALAHSPRRRLLLTRSDPAMDSAERAWRPGELAVPRCWAFSLPPRRCRLRLDRPPPDQ